MEEKKKFSAFDIINIIILGIGVVLAIIIIATPKAPFDDVASKVINIISIVATIVALISAAIYMIMRYTKKSAVLYKIFMFSFVIIFAMLTLFTMTIGSGNMLSSVIIIAILLLSVVLATARDYGKVKTFIIAGLLLIAHILLLLVGFVVNAPALLLSCILSIILTAEACIMVLAKYQDKDARGAK